MAVTERTAGPAAPASFRNRPEIAVEAANLPADTRTGTIPETQTSTLLFGGDSERLLHLSADCPHRSPTVTLNCTNANRIRHYFIPALSSEPSIYRFGGLTSAVDGPHDQRSAGYGIAGRKYHRIAGLEILRLDIAASVQFQRKPGNERSMFHMHKAHRQQHQIGLQRQIPFREFQRPSIGRFFYQSTLAAMNLADPVSVPEKRFVMTLHIRSHPSSWLELVRIVRGHIGQGVSEGRSWEAAAEFQSV